MSVGPDFTGLWGGFGLGQSLKRWRKALGAPEAVPSEELRNIDSDLRALRNRLGAMGAAARAELRARGGARGGFARPDQCDWAVRPAPWCEEMQPRGHVGLASPTALPGGVRVFHDAEAADLSLRQDPTPAREGGAALGLVLEVYRFDGTFVSFVQDLPEDAMAGLGLGHVISVYLTVEHERPCALYGRLNIQSGPNVEQMVREFEFRGADGVAEFDLAYSNLNEKRVEKGWLDLIIDGPEMTRIALWDMVITRAPRADL